MLRVIHLGFEVRVELQAEGHDGLWVQLSRHDPVLSVLTPGLDVWARAIDTDLCDAASGHQDPVAV